MEGRVCLALSRHVRFRFTWRVSSPSDAQCTSEPPAPPQGIPESRIAVLRGPLERSLEAKVAATVDKAKALAQEKQKEANRLITPAVQAKMMPAYGQATLEAGQGSHARRTALVEAHVEREKLSMFTEAIDPVSAGLKTLQKELAAFLQHFQKELSAALRHNYSPLWEAPDRGGAEARERLKAPFEGIAVEVVSAHRKLMKVLDPTSAAAQEPDIDDDEIEARRGSERLHCAAQVTTATANLS